MATTKSDFAQKLLHDLKLRKERMAASQSSSHSHSTGRDTYRSPAQTYRGSRQNKTLESVGSKPMNQRTRSSSRSRSLDIKESSQQIVSYERNGSSDYIGDPSVAFAYALQNGGKAGKLDFSSKNSSMIDFLHQIGRKSLNMGKMDRTGSFDTHRSSTSQFPTISHIHIKEISKGVQNLNQILRACSNGINFDKYSIEVGKELLKGAKGLEESLRMLVNLQEASEYMVSPQRKNRNRITLLDEDEEDEDNDVKIAEQRQLDLPRFSFDKRSRTSQGTNEAANQRLMAITYSTDPPSSMSHKRSASCGPDFRTLSTLSDKKNSASSVQLKSEKGRISNVIAKLMGLEEIPEKKEGRVDRSSNTNIKNAEIIKGEVEKLGTLTSNDGKAVQQAIKIQKTRDTAVSLKAEKSKVSSSANGGVPDGKTHRKDFERVNVTTGVLGSNKGKIAVDKRESHMGRSNQIPGNGRNGQDNERGHAKHKEQKSTEEGRNIEVKQNHRSPLVTDTLQEKNDSKKSKLQTEKIDEARLISQKDQGLLQQQMPLKSDQQVKNHGPEKSNQQMSKQELHTRKQDRSHIRSKVSSNSVHAATSIRSKQSHGNQGTPSKRSAAVIDVMPLKELPDNKENEDFSRDESSIKSSGDASSNKNESRKEIELNQEKKTGSLQLLRQEKTVHVPPIQKKEDSMYKREAPRKIDDVMSRRNGALDKLARPLKHQHSIMQELKQRRQEKMSSLEGVEQFNSSRSKGQEVDIESESNIQPSNEAKPIHEEDEWATITQNTGGDECQSPKVVRSPTFLDRSQSMTSEVLSVSNDQTGQAPDCIEDIDLMVQDSSQNPLAGANEGKMEICHVSNKKVPILGTQVVLTENEKHLKEILIKGHSFLNAAEALFKLNIPVGNLYAEDHNHRQDWEAKLKLDCGNELMRRKARSEEVIVHPYMKICMISYTKIRSLDELVKQLYKDFESLTFYGRKEELDAADYLHKMLERDIERNNDQDINSVWDFGWNEMMFAFVEKEEVTRDLEKYVLNGLIDEITQDLLSMTLSF